MGAYLGVQQGSQHPASFVHLTYTPPQPGANSWNAATTTNKNRINKRIVFVGKGVTFDSGGYNLKIGNSSIELMKMDMGGASAVFGAARAIAALKPEVCLEGI